MNRSTLSLILGATALAALAALAFVLFRVPNKLDGVELVAGQPIVLDTPLKFELHGTGTCRSVDIDWGDGVKEIGQVYVNGNGDPIDLSGSDGFAHASRTFKHTFTGWGGGKTVTVSANQGCQGKGKGKFAIPPLKDTIGFAQPGTALCQAPTTNWPDLVARTEVQIEAATLPPPNDRGINFGCFGGCSYGPDGRPGTSATVPYPFVGFREFSLVLRVGTQLVQGGANTKFITNQAGKLEFCLNDVDNDVTNNTGGFEFSIMTDQLGPP